jgi:hypothetical protein
VPDHPEQADLESLLDALADAGVDFIVVGGAAAVLHGAPVTTQDLDIVHRTDAKNTERLMTLLTALDARVRDLAGRDIRPDPAALQGSGQIRLTTRRGPLDLLCSLHDGRGYAELLPHTEELTDGSLRLRVLDLPTLIAIKSGSGRVRDQLILPLLIALERERGQGGE